jgi:hypothetical protein
MVVLPGASRKLMASTTDAALIGRANTFERYAIIKGSKQEGCQKITHDRHGRPRPPEENTQLFLRHYMKCRGWPGCTIMGRTEPRVYKSAQACKN